VMGSLTSSLHASKVFNNACVEQLTRVQPVLST
jgi:hypothetical protein